MNLKSELAKVKITNSYPYKIPNSNITLLSSDSASIDRYASNHSVIRIEIPIKDNFFNSLFNKKSNITLPIDTVKPSFKSNLNLFTTKCKDRVVMLAISNRDLCFTTKDFIHILVFSPLFTCDLVLLDIDTLSVVKIFVGVNSNKVPKYVWDGKYLKAIGFTSVSHLSHIT